jgi:hypothetical protein
MKQFIAGMLVAFAVITIYACQNPTGAQGSAKNPVLFKVNGHGVTAEEFFSSQPASQAVNEFVMLASMKEEARKSGAQVDKKKVTEDIEELKKNITGQGQTWEEFLKTQGMTEKAFLEQRETFSLFQALLKKKANVTEAEMKKVWEDDKQALINEYASKNHLPDSEKAKVTYEQVKDLARERVEMQKMGMVQGEVMNDIILNSKLEFVSLEPAKAKEISERIMGPAMERAKQQKEEQEKAKNAPEGGDKDAPATGANTPKNTGGTSDGKATAKPVGGADKGGK